MQTSLTKVIDSMDGDANTTAGGSGYKPGLSLVRLWRSAFFWALFVAGLLFQVFGPHLKIKDHRFILPPSLVSAGERIRPGAIVAQERIRQLLSGVLTVGGAVGLAVYHRKDLFGGHPRERDLVHRCDEIRPACRILK